MGARSEGICEVLLRYGAKIDRLDKDMKTPLMNATISNKGQIAQVSRVEEGGISDNGQEHHHLQ